MTTVLPTSWAVVPLGNVLARIEAGASFRCEERPPHAGETGVAKVSAVTWGTYDEDESKTVLTADRIDEDLLIRAGDFLFSRANTINLVGACVIARKVTRRVMLSDKILRLHVSGAEPAYVLQFLRSPAGRAEIERLATGNQESMRNIGQERIRAIQMPLPPVAEQRRIVAALEEHLSDLDAAVAGLERARANVLRYRQAVIDAETSTGDSVKLSSVLREPLRNGHSAPKSTDGRGVPVFSISAVTEGDFSERNTKLAAMDPARVASLWAMPGDIFVQRSNTPELVGTARLYRGPERFAVFPDLLIRVRTSAAAVPEYVELVLRSTSVRKYYRSVAQGIAGTMPKIDQGAVERTSIPLPSPNRQRAIVEEITAKLAVADRTAADIDVQLARAARLRQSILQRAFSGRLVRQDPADEPASALLARVRAERPVETAGRRPRAARAARS